MSPALVGSEGERLPEAVRQQVMVKDQEVAKVPLQMRVRAARFTEVMHLSPLKAASGQEAARKPLREKSTAMLFSFR